MTITTCLSSLYYSEDRSSVTDPNHKLSFRLLYEDFEMSFDEFCERLGFTNGGLIHDLRNPTLIPK